MVFTGSAGFSAAVLSSSCMPFLKALMPCATSPIRSEILPRPNNSRTTAITTIQCQILSEPILQPSKRDGQLPAKLWRKVGPRGIKNKDPGRGKSLSRLRIIAIVNPLAGLAGGAFRTSSTALFGIGDRRQHQFQTVARIQRIFILAQRHVVGRRRNAEAGRQPRIQ